MEHPLEDASVEPSSSVPTIQAGQLIRTPDSVITASGSVAGNIVIAAPNTNISSSLVVLPETFVDASSQLPPGVGRNARWRRSAAASACFPESSVPSGRQCPRADRLRRSKLPSLLRSLMLLSES